MNTIINSECTSVDKTTPVLVYLISSQTKEGDTFVAEVGAVKYGERGYYRTTYELQEPTWVNYMNARLGLSKAFCQTMEDCSMFNCWQNFEKILAKHQERFPKWEQNDFGQYATVFDTVDEMVAQEVLNEQ